MATQPVSSSAALIHPTAVVYPGAVIGEGTQIGPYSVIGPKVVLGRKNRIASHVVIEGNTTVGDENVFFQFCSVGAQPQDLKFHGEDSRLMIGNQNIIREYVTLQPGTSGGGMLTEVGNNNLFMANSHLGHDSKVGNGNVIANSVALAGHVVVEDFVTLGGLAAIHQFVRIGKFALLGGGGMLTRDLPCFCIAQGDRARLVGLNKIGMNRRGIARPEIELVDQTVRELFYATGTLKSKIETLKSKQLSPLQAELISFVESSKRGVVLPRRGRASDDDGDN